jgi:hypothetical protein
MIKNRFLKAIYKTPNRISWVVFLLVHAGLVITQAFIGNNYLLIKYNQFLLNPIITSFEILIPYLVTYLGNSIGRKLR